jgi:gliding motility-associated-like protein
MKKKLLLIITMFSCIFMYSQSSDCLNAQPFCTSTPIGFPASTNTTAPIGPDYGCLGSQPNPAFYFLQIDQPGTLSITMQSTPLVDIDFICWGPFTDPSTMCDNLTATYIEDCSYSPAPTEVCDIANAVAGEYYILLITNFSNVACNIDFSLTGGTGTTSCCLAGDAGLDNTVDFCNSDPSFIMENQLNGTPSSGGVWYDNAWAGYGGNSFDPSSSSSGSFSYIVPGIPVPGATVTCPDDTANLIININADPIINFPAFSEVCSDANAITLNSATPSGGTYSINEINSGTFTPDVSLLGANIITYNITDANGCSDTKDQNIIVNDVPILSLGSDQLIPCRSTFLISPSITGGVTPYTYLWSDGSSTSDLSVSDGVIDLVITDVNGCVANDQVTITQDITPTTSVTGGGEVCDNGSVLDITFEFNGLLPWNLVYSNGSVSESIFNINTPDYTLITGFAGDYEIAVASDINGCEADILGLGIVSLTVFPMPEPIISPSEVTVYENQEIELTVGNYASYEWYTIDNMLISNEEVLKVTDAGSFYVQITDDNGCIALSNVAIVNVVPITQLFVPNSFTPNGDDHNELFVIKGIHVIDFSLKIFDRWGEKLFESNSIEKHWDGSFNNNKVQQGTYYYNIEVYGEDGDLFVKSGRVNVIY